MRYADGAGEFEVEYEALAGQAQRKLSEGKIAYIGTGDESMHILHSMTSNFVLL